MFRPHFHLTNTFVKNAPHVQLTEQNQAPALFEKREIVDLSPEEMTEIDGGSTITITSTITLPPVILKFWNLTKKK